jgi:uncharacterized membrane protein
MKFIRAIPAQPLILKILVILVTGLLLGGWLYFTPPGLLGKADAVGYAVCHRIPERSFIVGDRQSPLCARCSGMYLGALLGIVYLGRSGRLGGTPSLKISIVLGVFLLAFALDGSNSYLHFFPSAPGLYQPQNWLRLITGTGLGLGIAAVLTPVFHQTVWQRFNPAPSLATWRQFLPLLALAGVVDAMIWSGNLLLMVPLALLSSAGILLILTMVYTVVWTMISKQENRFVSLQSMWVLLMAGFATALLQITVIDAGRYWLTGTWAGFNL